MASYRAALAAIQGGGAPANHAPAKGTLGALVAEYTASREWRALSPATRKQRGNILKHVLESGGAAQASEITRKTIIQGRDRREDTPAQARHFIDTMRGLFRWAVETERLETDPTAGVKAPPKGKGPGFVAWTESDVAAYHARWPVGTRQRVWLDVLLYTGLRRGDAARIGPAHVRDGVATIQTEKSGERIEVTLPILPALQRTLEAGPIGKTTFICGVKGERLTKEGFGNLFRDACREAGIRKSAHGVRKIAATTAANNGATVAELEAIFGWEGGRMASLYTKTADRRRLAQQAISKLSRD